MKVLLFLLLSTGLFAQQYAFFEKSDSLKAAFGSTAGDTVSVYNLNGQFKWVYISYVDTNATSGAITDTVQVFVSSASSFGTAAADTAIWVRAGLRAVLDGQVYSVITNTATNGIARSFLVNLPRPGWVKIVLANATYVSARRGKFVLRAYNENY